MPLIALTGGIASGKSTIARRLAEHGAVIVDADAIVRDVQRPGSPVLDAIADEFGARPHRPRTARSIAPRWGRWSSAIPRRSAASTRSCIPPCARESQRRFEEALAADPRAVVVYDVPLLVEARVDDPWDLIVVAHAPADVREARLIEQRGMDAASARARIASQVPDEKRLEIADVVIDTAGTLEHTNRAGRRAVGAAAPRAPPPDRVACTGAAAAAYPGGIDCGGATMGVFDRFRRRKKAPYEALSEEERMSRYLYLLNTLPALGDRTGPRVGVQGRSARATAGDVRAAPALHVRGGEEAGGRAGAAGAARAPGGGATRRRRRRRQSAHPDRASAASPPTRSRSSRLPQLLTQNGLMSLVAYHFLLELGRALLLHGGRGFARPVR